MKEEKEKKEQKETMRERARLQATDLKAMAAFYGYAMSSRGCYLYISPDGTLWTTQRRLDRDQRRAFGREQWRLVYVTDHIQDTAINRAWKRDRARFEAALRAGRILDLVTIYMPECALKASYAASKLYQGLQDLDPWAEGGSIEAAALIEEGFAKIPYGFFEDEQ